MPATVPAWWPRVVAAADRRRHVTGLLLAHATPNLTGSTLRLRFASPALARAWQDSGAQDALEGALADARLPLAVTTEG